MWRDTFIWFYINLRRLILNIGPNFRSIIALLVGLIVVVILYLLIPATMISPKGILLPTSNKPMAPISPGQVTFYSNASLGFAYQKVGYINVQFHSVQPSAVDEQALANYVRQLAAAAGANGVIITLFGHTLPNEVPNAQASYVFRGEAVYAVPNI